MDAYTVLWIGRISIIKMTIGNLQIQYNSYQTTKDIFHRDRTKNLQYL